MTPIGILFLILGGMIAGALVHAWFTQDRVKTINGLRGALANARDDYAGLQSRYSKALLELAQLRSRVKDPEIKPAPPNPPPPVIDRELATVHYPPLKLDTRPPDVKPTMAELAAGGVEFEAGASLGVDQQPLPDRATPAAKRGHAFGTRLVTPAPKASKRAVKKLGKHVKSKRR